MRFEWRRSIATGGCEVTAVPAEYDGHPTPTSLRLDHSPTAVNPGRLAVAAVLAFRPYVSGSLELPKPVSPEVAAALRSVLAPTEVFPGPVQFHPKALPQGTGELLVVPDGGRVPAGRPGSQLHLVSAAAHVGCRVDKDRTTVATNAGQLVPRTADELDRCLPFVAAAVLLAEDLDVGTLTLPVPGGRRRTAVGRLLEAVGLRLDVSGEVEPGPRDPRTGAASGRGGDRRPG